MEIKKATFVTSAVAKSGYPQEVFPQIAFVGRSNVGKSSLINSLVNYKGLAKVSRTPGRTRLVNFFLINENTFFVDLPGYGFAKVSKEEKKTWGKTIEDYLIGNTNLRKGVLLLDCRRIPSDDDFVMYNFFKRFGIEQLIILTKSDKLSKQALVKSESIIRKTLNMPKEEKIVSFSSLNKKGREELINNVFEGIE